MQFVEAPCRIEVLGPLRVIIGDVILDRFYSPRAATLLTFLALHLERSYTREEIIDRFWPTLPLDAGRDNLSTLLSALRRHLEPLGVTRGAYLIADRQRVMLNTATVSTDAQEFLRLIRRQDTASLERALRLYRGEPYAGVYDDWAVQEQGEWTERFESIQERSRILPPLIETTSAPDPVLIPSAPVAPSLPLELTRLIGREQVRVWLRDQVTDTSGPRLFTITGPGGCGKTRLSLTIAHDTAPAFAGRAYFVGLADLPTPQLIPSAIAQALNLPSGTGQPPLDRILSVLSTTPSFLLLDNLEHLMDSESGKGDSFTTGGVTGLIRLLLDRCYSCGLRILTTSRRPLNLPGEQIVPLLGLPRDDAVALFVERARAGRPDFALTPSNQAAIAEICERLDGLPLAIELAASRVRALTVEDIRQRLRDRFRLLTHTDRSKAPRQKTLRALMDWSYELLSPKEKAFFSRLSVFAGGWTIAAAEVVCEEPKVLDLLTTLTEHSLICSSSEGNETRFMFLETIREYARERLVESGDREPSQQRHQQYFLDYASNAALLFRGKEEAAGFSQIDRESGNLRSALDTLSGDLRLQLATSLAWYWYIRGQWQEGRAFLRSALTARDTALRDKARADGLHALTMLDGSHSPQKEELQQEALAIRREIGDWRGVVACLNNLAVSARSRYALTEAKAFCEEGLAICHQHPELRVETMRSRVHLQAGLSTIAGLIGDQETAFRLKATTLEECKRESYHVLEAELYIELAYLYFGRRLFGEAVYHARQAFSVAEEIGYCKIQRNSLLLQGRVCLEKGDRTASRDHLNRATVIEHPLNSGDEAVIALSFLSCPLAIADGAREEAKSILQILADAFTEPEPNGYFLAEQSLAYALHRKKWEVACLLLGWSLHSRSRFQMPAEDRLQAEQNQVKETLKAKLGEPRFMILMTRAASQTLRELLYNDLL